MQEQCYAYAKQAGIKENEIDYSIMGSTPMAAQARGVARSGESAGYHPRSLWQYTHLYRSQGHLLEVTDVVDKMQKVQGGLYPGLIRSVMHKGKAYGVPQSLSPRPLVTRLDLLAAAKVAPPKTWDELIEVSKKLQKPPKLTGYGMCLGLTPIPTMIFSISSGAYGGKLVEADNKTVTLHSPGTIAAVQFIADMYHKHKIIPKGSTSWDNTGNNKAYQSRQVIFVTNARVSMPIWLNLTKSCTTSPDCSRCRPVPRSQRCTRHGGMDTFQAQPLSRDSQRAGRVLDGPGEPAGDDRGRRWALGTTVQRHV